MRLSLITSSSVTPAAPLFSTLKVTRPEVVAAVLGSQPASVIANSIVLAPFEPPPVVVVVPDEVVDSPQPAATRPSDVSTTDAAIFMPCSLRRKRPAAWQREVYGWARGRHR